MLIWKLLQLQNYIEVISGGFHREMALPRMWLKSFQYTLCDTNCCTTLTWYERLTSTLMPSLPFHCKKNVTFAFLSKIYARVARLLSARFMYFDNYREYVLGFWEKKADAFDAHGSILMNVWMLIDSQFTAGKIVSGSEIFLLLVGGFSISWKQLETKRKLEDLERWRFVTSVYAPWNL